MVVCSLTQQATACLQATLLQSPPFFLCQLIRPRGTFLQQLTTSQRQLLQLPCLQQSKNRLSHRPFSTRLQYGDQEHFPSIRALTVLVTAALLANQADTLPDSFAQVHPLCIFRMHALCWATCEKLSMTAWRHHLMLMTACRHHLKCTFQKDLVQELGGHEIQRKRTHLILGVHLPCMHALTALVVVGPLNELSSSNDSLVVELELLLTLSMIFLSSLCELPKSFC